MFVATDDFIDQGWSRRFGLPPTKPLSRMEQFESVRTAVRVAVSYGGGVEFSPVDAARESLNATASMIAMALDEGVSTINIRMNQQTQTVTAYADMLDGRGCPDRRGTSAAITPGL